MNHLQIKYLAAKNFVCFGPEGIEINLENLGNVVLIKGQNLDTIDQLSDEEDKDKIASNGVGKSSIPDILVYTLFGKTIKNPKKIGHNNVINNKSKEKLVTEVHVNDLRVIRTRKPDSLRIWQSKDAIWDKDTEVTKGGMTLTQAFLEETLGLTYESFVNLLVFTDNNACSFLEYDTPAKREFVENILLLDRYRSLFDIAKKFKNDANAKIKEMGRDLENSINDYESAKRRIQKVEEQEQEWKKSKSREMQILITKMQEKQDQLKSSDIGPALTKWEQAQEKMSEIQTSLPAKEEKVVSVKTMLEEAQGKLSKAQSAKDESYLSLSNFKLEVAQLEKAIVNHKKYINDAEARRCKFCNQTDEDIITESQKKLTVDNEKLTTAQQKRDEEQAKYDQLVGTYNKINELIKTANAKLNQLVSELDTSRKNLNELSKINKPEISSTEKILTEQVQDLKQQILGKKQELDGPSPFIEIMKSSIEEAKEKEQLKDKKKTELDNAVKKLPYYEFWVHAFGESGIRKFVIDGIIPALNSRIAHWLQFLIDGKFKLSFNNKLEETIHRNPEDGDPFVYYVLSGGERRRLNLSVSQAWSYIAMLNVGTCPSAVFLDEVSTNIDPVGVQGVYNMIMELSKERQVFVTTHDHDLLNLLHGCETISLKKKDGFTTLVA